MNIDPALARVRRLARRVSAAVPIGADRFCCICGRSVRRFLPYRDPWPDMPPVLTEAGVIGSDIENFECPACGCHDRERHLFLYLQATGLLAGMTGQSLLHLAPERHLQRLIARTSPQEYVLGDLFPTRADIQRIDLTDIPYPQDSFDWVIANHVLEHVSDDAQSLREIRRVLRPGGHAILQTPYASLRPGKFEDASIVTADARLQAYGQEDHCRLYGADFADYVASLGFVSQRATHAALLPTVDPHRMGVNEREPFLLFRKADQE